MNKQILAALIVAFVLGGVEMRVTLARVEQSVADIDKRVQRIEGSSPKYAKYDSDP